MRFSYISIKRLRAASVALFIIVLSGCGLPSYSTLDAPSEIDFADNKVGFNAAEEVDGYIIYYKIYPYNDSEIDSDEDQFDSSYYDDDNIPNGTTVPENLGFTKMAWADTSSLANPIIEYTGDDDVVIDFSNSINQDSGTDPVLYINDVDMSSSMGVPGRGVKSDSNLYKHFVKDYDFDDDDLSSSVQDTANEAKRIHIAFVAISYGLDPSSLESSMSIPVYLGTVNQQNFEETAE